MHFFDPPDFRATAHGGYWWRFLFLKQSEEFRGGILLAIMETGLWMERLREYDMLI